MKGKQSLKGKGNITRSNTYPSECMVFPGLTVVLTLIITGIFALPVLADQIDEFLKRGTALKDSGQIDQAIVKFEEVLKLKPKHAIANFELGQCHLEKKECETSIRYLNNALSFGYDPLEGHLALAEAYRVCDKNTEAVMEYQLAIGIQPNNPALHVELGDLSLEKGSIQLAEKEYSKALEIDRKYVPAMLGLANVCKKRGQLKEAESFCEKAKTTNPDYALTYCFLGEFYALQKQYDKSMSELTKYTLLEPKNPKGYIALAEVHEKMRDYPSAIKDIRQAIEYGDTAVSNLRFLASLYAQNKQPYEAGEVLKQIVAKVPEDVTGWLDLAKVSSETDSFQAAASAYHQALSLDSTQLSSIAFNLGLVYYQLAKYDSAVAMFSEKIRLDSLATGAYVNRALSYMQLKRYKPEAIDDFKKALKNEPNYIQVHLWLAQIYAFLNMRKAAKTEFHTVLKLDPENKEAKEGLKELDLPSQP